MMFRSALKELPSGRFPLSLVGPIEVHLTIVVLSQAPKGRNSQKEGVWSSGMLLVTLAIGASSSVHQSGGNRLG